MRFDDKLATVLGRNPDRESARISQWRQLLDLLAQHRDGDDPMTARAVERFAELRARVPVEARREAVIAIAGRPLVPGLVAMLAADVPAVAGALLARVSLDEAAWIDLLPRLTPTARGFVRHRRDLGMRVGAALSGFGSTDFTLTGTIAAAPAAAIEAVTARMDEEPELPLAKPTPPAAAALEPGAGEGQIRAIISRIARFRSGHDEPPAPPPAPTTFRFETNAVGIVTWVDGVPRGPLIGETIASPADGSYGVDAQAPGAFRSRAPFRDARLTVAGTGISAGEWRIAGVPAFAPADGRFLGYRCTARRPRAGERAQAAIDPDTLRQLVHELRTPINAIGGFAEMIRRQMRGPVAEPYRDRARGIVDEAARLMTAVDDLDVSARLDSDRLGLQRAAVDLASIADAVVAEHRDVRAGAAASVRTVSADPPLALGDVAAIRRMVARLVAATTALADVGEAIAITIDHGAGDTVELALPRPARLAGIAEAELLDPGFDAAGEWPDAPLLGLGFSLHLVRRLAAAAGGTLVVEEHRLVLGLPAVAGDDARLG
ncbi:sensor histidine kinase [Sphingomonas sp.]|uniref:sensor histidine kinase n=1 Tax=Sphingomonas sp. TaxID=28214 RepID=UPI003B00B1BF